MARLEYLRRHGHGHGHRLRLPLGFSAPAVSATATATAAAAMAGAATMAVAVPRAPHAARTCRLPWPSLPPPPPPRNISGHVKRARIARILSPNLLRQNIFPESAQALV
ncbi:hypothetical protein COCCADRAFT_88351 [Bipolaris zeicola 26-R-13]|uniref:Uncharacterized protein n=1 Tax=Cochliobolus carbonum (strain 26-R-13) TaxID=930089 RepID=W6YF95_COCC2|nr:uncharacterized protein COCCADRAFT_88351 [Bipolaris zeicola 26-R-13]EUC36350.1 hypothetical protein COCCADRAFT_88351 [Bipolaris zeicola 26-R-13]